jgi:hypothetical protein
MGHRLAWALPLAGRFSFAGAVFAPRECTTYIAESTITGKWCVNLSAGPDTLDPAQRPLCFMANQELV